MRVKRRKPSLSTFIVSWLCDPDIALSLAELLNLKWVTLKVLNRGEM